jgi:dihydrodipicolinate synthase/N-acetylneuraminate lyase
MPDRLQGLFAIIPTPAKASASRWDAVDTVDLDESERLINQLIKDGANGFIILGTTGECATLTKSEYEKFADCVLSTVGKRVPTYVGTTALGMHEIVERIRFVRDLGADGTLLGLPMWQPVTRDMAVNFYTRISEGFPDFPVMAYANQRAFRFKFDAEFWKAVAQKAPTVTSAKHSKSATLLDFIAATEGKVQFVSHQSAAYKFAQLSPDTTTACWSTAASCGPEPALAIINAIRARDMGRAGAVLEDLNYAADPLKEIVAIPELFASYTIQLEKIRMDAAGYCKAGPIRPPYDVIPEEYAEAARESGRRWAGLRAKYTA